jgi:hypothetical protein
MSIRRGLRHDVGADRGARRRDTWRDIDHVPDVSDAFDTVEVGALA